MPRHESSRAFGSVALVANQPLQQGSTDKPAGRPVPVDGREGLFTPNLGLREPSESARLKDQRQGLVHLTGAGMRLFPRP